MSWLIRLRPFWILAAGCLASSFAPADASATVSVASDAARPAVQGRKKRRKRGKADVHNAARAHGTAHRREHRKAARLAAKGPTPAPLAPSPGPAQTPEALRAMDDVRRLQIERAESAARREDVTNRWETVSFLISGVDEQRYPAAGFWKILASYRRGHISEGDSARQKVRLAAADGRALDAERSVATTLVSRAGGVMAVRNTAVVSLTPERPEDVVNNTPYTGPGPTADGGGATAP